MSNYFDNYLNLTLENQRLLEENAKLHSMLKSSMQDVGQKFYDKTDTVGINLVQKYKYTNANIINNSYRRRNNNITIDKGYSSGIVEESGVITQDGIIGVVESVGGRFSSVLSILNNKLSINAKIKNSSYFGSLSWPGADRQILILSDVPKQAEVAIGDTIVTGGYSGVFPENINIGSVTNITLPPGSNYYEIEVKTFVDYANIKSVYVVKNLLKQEIESIEKNNK